MKRSRDFIRCLALLCVFQVVSLCVIVSVVAGAAAAAVPVSGSAPVPLPRLIAITVAVQYDDFLEIVAPLNQRFFHAWYLAVVASDSGSQRWCDSPRRPAMAECVTVPEGTDKFTMLSTLQSMAYQKYSGGVDGRSAPGGRAWNASYPYYLILDADVLLPEGFGEALARLPAADPLSRRFYSLPRAMFWTPFSWQVEWPFEVNNIGTPCGYFELYSAPLLYPTPNGKGADSQGNLYAGEEFTSTVLDGKHRAMDDDLVVCHLGRGHQNWKGRQTPRWDVRLAKQCRRFPFVDFMYWFKLHVK